MVWTLIEPGVAIVASSLVTIRPLLRQLRLKGFESSENSRSGNGFWARYGRSGGDRYGNRKLSAAKRSRAASGGGLDAFEMKGGDAVKLHDLEAGYASTTTTTNDGGKKALPGSKGGRGYYCSSRETTLTSANSSRDREFGTSPVRNFSAPLRIAAAAAAVSAPAPAAKDDTIAAVHKEADGKNDDDDDDTPVSPWMLRATESSSPSGLTFPQQQQPATLRGYVQNGKTMWRSATPNSAEEAEAIQGLRELSSRTGGGRSPFS